MKIGKLQTNSVNMKSQNVSERGMLTELNEKLRQKNGKEKQINMVHRFWTNYKLA